jgi:hypothetical protein
VPSGAVGPDARDFRHSEGAHLEEPGTRAIEKYGQDSADLLLHCRQFPHERRAVDGETRPEDSRERDDFEESDRLTQKHS